MVGGGAGTPGGQTQTAAGHKVNQSSPEKESTNGVILVVRPDRPGFCEQGSAARIAGAVEAGLPDSRPLTSRLMLQLRALCRALIVSASIVLLSGNGAAAVAAPRVRLSNSVVGVPAVAAPARPHLTRNVLTTRELEQSVDFVVS